MTLKVINIYFDKESLKALQEIKKQTGKNNSQIVRTAVKKLEEAKSAFDKLREIYCDL